MKNKAISKKTYLFILSLLFYISANAQLGLEDVERMRFGVRAGFGFSTLSGIDGLNHLPGTNYASTPYTTAMRPSWDIGITLQITFFNELFSQIDMFYSKMGAELKDANVKGDGDKRYTVEKINLNYLTVDQYLGKKLKVSNTTSLLLAGGAYFSFDIGNLLDTNNDDYKSDDWYLHNFSQKGMDSNLADFNYLDLGLSLMMGVESEKIQVAINYNYGLLKLVDTSDYSMRNRVGKIVFTYFF